MRIDSVSSMATDLLLNKSTKQNRLYENQTIDNDCAVEL